LVALFVLDVLTATLFPQDIEPAARPARMSGAKILLSMTYLLN